MSWEQYDRPVVVPDEAAIARYWGDLRARMKATYAAPRATTWGTAEGTGWHPWVDDHPETVAFGTTPEEVDDEVALLSGRVKTAWSRPKVFFDGIGPERTVGDIALVLGRDGRPALAVTVDAVSVARFGDVTEEYAEAEALGDFTLADWRAVTNARFAAETGLELRDDDLLYLLRISVV
ncbi:MAG: ASCH domain-containing protein [Nocardioidaceae bacterium]|nr:ASCH domain-containing protein [Nocardioidaceae bacterium]MCL2612134.1 ASCH domain-containing protein [Nocardioidaceae bacterium]